MVNILKIPGCSFFDGGHPLFMFKKPILTPKNRRTVMEITNQGGQTYTKPEPWLGFRVWFKTYPK